MGRTAPPDGVRRTPDHGPARERWLAGLPRLRDALLAEWRLASDGPARPGSAALVLPVRTRDGVAATLKVSWPEEEGEHEHLALQHWGGEGAVRLLRADPRRRALLLERLSERDLGEQWDLEACEIVAGLLGRLHITAPPQVRRLTTHLERRTAGLAALPRDAALPHRLVEQARSLGRDLAAEPGEERLLHTDLHYGTVLAADREPWLAVAPRPMAGDPHFELAPMLWHRYDELAGDVRGGLRRRFHTLVDAAGMDEDRARDWVVVRMVHLAADHLADPRPTARDRLTVCITVAKAVQE